MSIPDIPRNELETVFQGRPQLAALWEKITRGETEFSSEEQSQLLLAEARVYDLRGESLRTLRLAEAAEELARRCNFPGSIGTALGLRGYVLLRFGEYDRARPLMLEALPLLEGNPEIVFPLRGLAIIAYSSSDWASAETYFDRAVKAGRALGFDFGLCTSLLDIAELYYAQGRFEVALSALEECNRVMARAGISVHRGFYFLHLAGIYCLTGRRTLARDAIEGLSRFADTALLEIYYHLFDGWLALLEEDLAAAEKGLTRAQQLAERLNDVSVMGYVRLLTSRLYRLRDAPGRALEWADEAVNFMRRSTVQNTEAAALMERASVYTALNDTANAEADLQRVSDIANRLGARYLAAQAALQRAALHRQLKRDDADTLWLDAVQRIRFGGYEFLLEQERATAFPLVAHYARHRTPALRASAEALLEQLARVPPLPLRVLGLGQFKVWQGGRKIPDAEWSKRRAGELLRFLLLQPAHTASRDTLLDALVPDASPASAQVFLHHATSALRRILEPELPEKFPSRYLELEGQVIRLQLPPGSWMDFQAFEDALRATNPTVEALEAAIKLYAGELFPADRYADWSVERRERLAELARAARLALAAAELERGAFQAALDTCRTILRDDPWREDAVLIAMRACLALNDRPAALKLYRALEHALREDLDLAPRPDLTALARSLTTPA